MLGSIALAGIALAPIAIAAPADPTITPAAILPRQNNDQFVGWVQSGGTWFSESCVEGLTWSQDGTYGQCCPTTVKSCYAPTACFSGSLVYPYPDISSTRTIACTENFGNVSYSICNTALIFENMQDSSPQTDIVCGESAVNWSYYRAVPASITEAATRAAFSLPPNGSGSKSKGTSKALIAGAVVGALLGLALIGAIIFFVLRRRRNRTTAQQGSAAMAPANPSQPPPGVGGGYTDAKPQFTQQQQPASNDPYANQSAYAAQQGYADAPISPMPQYNAPYNPPNSPPPQDVKYGYAAPGVAPVNQHVPIQQTAELGGDSQHGGPGPAELPSGGAR